MNELELKNIMQERPKIGVGVIIIKDGKILLGKRRGSHGDGSWSFPGGHLEFNENIFDCAVREVLEETGIKIKNLRFGPFTNDIFEKEGKHYVTLFVLSDYDSGEVELKEPEKCEKWDWFEWENFPEELFVPIRNLLKQDYNPVKSKMNFSQYQELAKKTAKTDFATPTEEIMCWGLGLAGESGDVASCIKKVFAHKNLTVKKGIRENLGDLLWYFAMICNFFNWNIEEILQENIIKLEKRYPDGFKFENAQREGTKIKWGGVE